MRCLSFVVAAVALASACKSSAPPPSAPPSAEKIDVRVDPRVELISILQRLVGEREYKTAPRTRYIVDVDRHFAAFAHHPAVAATRALRRNSITYDAPMQLAVSLDDDFQLKARPDDPRFANVELDGYLASVRDFAAASGFAQFFARHRDYYTKLSDKLRAAIETEAPQAWFDTFFGKRAGAPFVIVVAPVNGDWNYGPHADGSFYAIMGVMRIDFDEMLIVDDRTMDLVVHEMAHSYINPLFERHRAALEPHGTRLFAKVAAAMKKGAYGFWHIFMNEQGVRAITTLYIYDKRGRDAADAAAQSETARSFLWTPQIAKLLREKYVGDRKRYRDLDSFMPELFASLATFD